MTLLDAWTERLGRAAISEADRRAVTASETARALVLERIDAHRGETVESAFEDRDALHGWTVLGRVLADAGASPSLVAQVVDALLDAAEPSAKDPGGASGRIRAWAAASRSVLVEAFVAAQRDLAEARAAEAWRFPKCVVRLDETTAAVAASFPDDDPDALARWADEIAAGLAKMGIRRVHAEGTARARAALDSSLSVAGIDVAGRARGPGDGSGRAR
jgi:hypothetical protein